MGQQLTKSCPSHDRSLYKPQGLHKQDNIDLRKLKKLIKVSHAGGRTKSRYLDENSAIVLNLVSMHAGSPSSAFLGAKGSGSRWTRGTEAAEH
jgi:hypothetical protein